MPYRDDYGPYRDSSETLNKLDKVTALLCHVCTKLKNQEIFNHLLDNNKELKEWWVEHQIKDLDNLLNLMKEKLNAKNKQK